MPAVMQLAMGETSVLATPKRYSQETAVEGDVKVNYDQNSVEPGPCLIPIGYEDQDDDARQRVLVGERKCVGTECRGRYLR